MNFKNYKYMQAETRLSEMLDYSLFCIHFPSMRYELIFPEISAFRRGEVGSLHFWEKKCKDPTSNVPFLFIFSI